MKKVLFLAVALLMTAGAFAQTPEQMQASKERLAKLEKLSAAPKACGSASIDALSGKSEEIAKNAVVLTPFVQAVCYSALGQNIDGVADASVAKPNVVEVTALSLKLADQAKMIKEAGEQVEGAANEVKAIKNPMKIKPAASNLSYAKDVLAVAGEETAFQAQVIAEMIKTLSDK